MLIVSDNDNNIFSKSIRFETKGGKVLAELGILDVSIRKSFDIEKDVYFADINWSALTKAIRKHEVTFTEITKFPSVSRDLALLVDKSVTFKQIEDIARQSEKKLLKKVERSEEHTSELQSRQYLVC